MKKIVINMLWLLALVVTATSCSTDTTLFGEDDSFVAFHASSFKGSETDAAINVQVVVGALKSSTPVDVTVEVMADTGRLIAKEGKDFTIASKTLEFADGMGVMNIVVKPIDNSIFTGNKTFRLKLASNSANYPTGAISIATVTLSDDEHPLGRWIGSYSVACASYGKPGAWDEAWSVKTAPDPSDVNNLLITGIAKSSDAITATIDTTAMTITIKGGTELVGEGSYSLGLYLGTEDLTVPDKGAKIIGTISPDGLIHIDHLTPMIIAGTYKGSVWDTFNTTWTKQ